ncbi:unnamed protein product [Ostreobium quekettii]|uniref:UBC core domain-containing protein n=1 Tax=Ostreobium quekettii TaxID=121088 RepID=A0A8S1ISQ5_9CHLO|nr:unnamed protein product [Ostreobium quekettii]|eukprot:evm.model.scf_467.6 EVM.evm.TU.scf_467.6   scf_467:61579-65176(+)
MPSGDRAAKGSDPPWKGLTGDRRVQREFRALRKLVEEGGVPQVADLEYVNDSIRRWSLKLKNFDDDVPGGRQLNQDLAQLAARHGQDHLAMEITFPEDYPQQPFFIRVVTPRCRWYTGHVTAGGSICIEALTLSGTPNSWQPDYCVESMLNIIIHNMIDCEVVYVQTPTGPGGLSGPLRIDLERKYTSNVMAPYSEYEAQSAFRRMEANHQRLGWGPTGGASGSGQASRARSSARLADKAGAGGALLSAKTFGGSSRRMLSGGGLGRSHGALSKGVPQLPPPAPPPPLRLGTRGVEGMGMSSSGGTQVAAMSPARKRAKAWPGDVGAGGKVIDLTSTSQHGEQAAVGTATQQQPAHYTDTCRQGMGMDPQRMEVDFNDEGLVTMMHSGVSYSDAVAALGEVGGDLDAAVAFQIECLDRGGAAAVLGMRR